MVIRYVCAQPAIPYYTWQVEVMIHNFMKNGINPNYIDVVCGITDGIVPEQWLTLSRTYNYVRFFFYDDTRVDKTYIPSIRPHILRKHFAALPELTRDVIFYHDCDMIFTKPVDWTSLAQGKTWYTSDTRYYISAEYIRSKGEDVYESMCRIVDIDHAIPIRNELHSGGAQYIMKSVTSAYWEKVEEDCTALYHYFLEHLRSHPESPTYHPIQKWTADMWAVLWNAWYFGHTAEVHPTMEFAWAIHGPDAWEKYTIYHNAGVTHDTQDRYFYKGNYLNSLPYTADISVSKDYASWHYAQEIKSTGLVSCLV